VFLFDLWFRCIALIFTYNRDVLTSKSKVIIIHMSSVVVSTVLISPALYNVRLDVLQRNCCLVTATTDVAPVAFVVGDTFLCIGLMGYQTIGLTSRLGLGVGLVVR